MSTSPNPKNQNSTFTSVPAPPGAVQVCPPRKSKPGFRRIVIGWRPVPLHADLADDIAIGERRARGDKNWRPINGPRCPRCWLKNAKPGHFCRWDVASATASPKRVVYLPEFRWVPD